ncbi:MAG: acetoin dehydrogenase dihydrolipoyllysine-residue acetyltransferase subunit [Gammaproteobacteria bacterium]
MSDNIEAITMPKWGLAMQEGMLVDWHVNAGEQIAKGQEIADIETEKIANSFEAPTSGTLRRILADAGESLPVGALLGVVADESVSDADLDAYIAEFNEQFAEVLAARAADSDTGPEPETVDTAAGTIRYLTLGEAEGTPVVFIHGFGGDLNNWLFNQAAVAETHTTFALDLPGHGGSTKALEAADVPALAGAVLAFMDTAEIDRAHLVGHSLGGAIAAHIGTGNPHRTASATLVCSAGLGSEINIDYIEGFIAASRRKDLKPLVQQLFADPALVTRDLLDDLLKFKRLDGVEAALKQISQAVFAGGSQSLVLSEQLAASGVPVQVIVGSDDHIIPASHADALEGKAAVHRLGGAGHMVHMEKASDVNELLMKFFASA